MSYPVVHFEMPYEDRDRAADFYAKAFGWGALKHGPEMGNYMTVMTSETDPGSMAPKERGMINGGLYQKHDPSNVPSVVVAVDDIHEAMKRVAEAGGTVIGGRAGAGQADDIPGVGLYVSIIDSEGNKMAMLQPKMK